MNLTQSRALQTLQFINSIDIMNNHHGDYSCILNDINLIFNIKY